MTEQQRSKNLFDALLKAAVAEAFETEMDALPTDEAPGGYEPSPSLDQRIKAVIRKRNRRVMIRRTARTIGKIAACLCILLTVSTVVLMSVDATRIAIFNAVIEWNEKYTAFQFDDSSGSDFKRPSYLPEGYTEKSAEFHEIIAQLVYENSAGNQIIVSEQKAEGSTTAVDNERHEYSEIQINGTKAYLFKAKVKDEANILLWEAHGIVYTVLAVIDSPELIRIAESL